MTITFTGDDPLAPITETALIPNVYRDLRLLVRMYGDGMGDIKYSHDGINPCEGVGECTACELYDGCKANEVPICDGSQLVTCYEPTQMPTASPSNLPSVTPTTSTPSVQPSMAPVTSTPTNLPSDSPETSIPTRTPSASPESSTPTRTPSNSPVTSLPTFDPTQAPITSVPTLDPSRSPTVSSPTHNPTQSPVTSVPTRIPSASPETSTPTQPPSFSPITSQPSHKPSQSPSTSTPTNPPSASPTTSSPTNLPSASPTTPLPTQAPTTELQGCYHNLELWQTAYSSLESVYTSCCIGGSTTGTDIPTFSPTLAVSCESTSGFIFDGVAEQIAEDGFTGSLCTQEVASGVREYVVIENGQVYSTCVGYSEASTSSCPTDLVVCASGSTYGWKGNQVSTVNTALAYNDNMHPACPRVQACTPLNSWWMSQYVEVGGEVEDAENLCVRDDGLVMYLTTEGRVSTCVGYSEDATLRCELNGFLCSGVDQAGYMTFGSPKQIMRTVLLAVSQTSHQHPQCPF